MAETSKLENRTRTVELVAHASGSFVNLWASESEMYIATSDDELGRWVATAVLDEKHPEVAMGTPGAGVYMKAASRIADALLPPGLVDDDVGDRVAVHLVVRVQTRTVEGSDVELDVVAVVWPPRGGPRNAAGYEELGAIIRSIADDESQPKVPAGPPPDAGGELLDRASRGIAALTKGE